MSMRCDAYFISHVLVVNLKENAFLFENIDVVRVYDIIYSLVLKQHDSFML